MNEPIVKIHAPRPLDTATRRSLLVCGLWMRAGFVGASATAIGIIQFFQNEWSPLTAMSTAAGGVALAVFSWRRAHAALSNREMPARLRSATPAAAHR